MNRLEKIKLMQMMFYYDTVEGIDLDNIKRFFEILGEFEKVDFWKWHNENNLDFGKWISENDVLLTYGNL